MGHSSSVRRRRPHPRVAECSAAVARPTEHGIKVIARIGGHGRCRDRTVSAAVAELRYFTLSPSAVKLAFFSLDPLLSTRGDIPPDRFFARAISLPSQLNSSPTVSILAVQLLNSLSPVLLSSPPSFFASYLNENRGVHAVIAPSSSAPCGVMSARPWNMKIFCHFRLYLHLKRRKRQIEATDGRTRTWCRC